MFTYHCKQNTTSLSLLAGRTVLRVTLQQCNYFALTFIVSAISEKTYGNFSLGIKDRSVFDIPHECVHQPSRDPVSFN